MGNNLVQTSAKSLIHKLLISSVAERNYSSQEVIHSILGWPLMHASRTFTMLSCNSQWRNFKESTTTIIEKYARREHEFDALNLHDYARSYRCDYRNKTDVTREKDSIVTVKPYIVLSEGGENNEKYFELQAKLYVPRRGNFNNF